MTICVVSADRNARREIVHRRITRTANGQFMLSGMTFPSLKEIIRCDQFNFHVPCPGSRVYADLFVDKKQVSFDARFYSPFFSHLLARANIARTAHRNESKAIKHVHISANFIQNIRKPLPLSWHLTDEEIFLAFSATLVTHKNSASDSLSLAAPPLQLGVLQDVVEFRWIPSPKDFGNKTTQSWLPPAKMILEKKNTESGSASFTNS
jgi:hypothetical protein